MARQTNTAITYDDANYMIDNEGFSRIGGTISGKQCMTRSDIEAYMDADPSFFSSYASNRLVPYNLLNAVACVNDDIPQNVRIVKRILEAPAEPDYDLQCDAVSGVIYYNIYRDHVLYASSNPSNVYTIGKLADVGSYCWSMTTLKSCESDESACATFETTPPTKPSNLRFREEFTPV